MLRFLVLVMLAVGCGDNAGSPGLDGGMGPDAAPDAQADAALDAPPDASPDAFDGVAIASVATADGFTQICHGCADEVIVSGTKLAAVTTVSLGPIAGTILSASETELRVELAVPGGFVPGPQVLTVDGPDGTASIPEAIEITPKVIAALAPVTGGHATFQSPMNLCDLELGGGCDGCRRTTQAFDTVLLLPGEYVCDSAGGGLPDGVIVQGSGVATTTITTLFGFGFSFGIDGPRSEVRDLTIIATDTNPTINAFAGQVLVDNVVAVGGGIRVDAAFGAAISNYTFTGPGTAISIQDLNGLVTVSNTTISDCTIGIFVTPFEDIGGGATIDDVEIRRCTRGLQVGEGPSTFSAQAPNVTATQLQLIDNAIGIGIVEGVVELFATTISDDEVTAPATTTGIAIGNGDVIMSGGAITGQSTGLSIRSSIDTFPTATIDGTTIEGGAVGIGAASLGDPVRLTLRRAIVRDQMTAAILVNGEETICDLGTASDPGQNALSVIGGFALDDRRTDTLPVGELSTAVGTTLNGTSFAGQLLQGPLTLAPHLRIATSDGTWQF